MSQSPDKPNDRDSVSKQETSIQTPDLNGSVSAGCVMGGRYRLIERIGTGGTGDIFRAEHTELGETAALKILRNPGDAVSFNRFRDEAKALWRIRHQNILKLIDFGVDADVPYMVVEYLPGKSLGEILATTRVPPRRFTMQLMDQLLDGLEAAHREGIVHRDVAPGNIFCVDYRSTKDPLQIRLVDFGLVSMHGIGEIWGTLGYMSPEQAKGAGVDLRSDIYSAGVVLYELLTGELPYAAGSLPELLVQFDRISITPLNEMLGKSAVSLELSQVALRALARDPEDRYQSAEEFRRALWDAFGSFATESSRPPVARAISQSHAVATDEESPSPSEVKELHQLLKRVREFWVDGLLTRNAGKAAMLPQPKTLSDEWVETPWKSAKCTSPLTESLDPACSLSEVFERFQHRLLILGDSGHGKTVNLLKLLRSACDAADNQTDFQHPIPVLFTLSSWNDTKGGFVNWMVEELAIKYAVPRKFGRKWMEQRYILPFLDGLNEVKSGNIAACIREINSFSEIHTPRGLVVTCRKQEYFDCGLKLRLNGCVTLDSFEQEAIRRFLLSDRWKNLRTAVEKTPELKEMIRVPLILRIALEIVDDGERANASSGTPTEITDAIFKRYVELNLRKKPEDSHGADEQERKEEVLHQLAKGMLHTGETVFLLETMQPVWIRGPVMRSAYAIASRLIAAYIFGLSIILAMGLSPLENAGFRTDLKFGVLLGLIGGAILGLGYGIVAVLSMRTPEAASGHICTRSIPVNLFFNMGLGLLIGGVLYGIYHHKVVFFLGIETALLGGVLLGLSRRRQSVLNGDIAPVETISWHIGGLFNRRFLLVVIGGLLISAVLMTCESVKSGLYMLCTVLIVGGVMLGLKKGCKAWKPAPNAGIFQSAKNAVFAGGLGFLLTTLTFAYSYGLLYGACVAVTVGAAVALWFGGIEVINHVVLRVSLAAEGTLKFFIGKSLSEAVEICILRQVGGGFMFEHETFIKHFAGVHCVQSR